MIEIKSEEGETREFVVVPPEGAEFDQPEKHREIEAALTNAFPSCKFQVTTVPTRYDDFFFLPIMGVAGDPGNAQPMLKPPAIELVDEITRFLAEYQNRAKTVLH